VKHDPVSGVDLFPTLCELMSLPAPPKDIDGESLITRWQGRESRPEREIVAGQGTPGSNRARMIRTQRYKYARYDDGGEEFYDLRQDPDELENRVSDPACEPQIERFRKRTAQL
jgi:iduronate 2-sulfatase